MAQKKKTDKLIKPISEMTVRELAQTQRDDRQKDREQSLAKKPVKFRQPFKRP